MLRTLCTILLAGTAARAFEFGRAGQVVPAGGVSLSYTSQGDNSDLILNLRPQVGYFVLDHVALGGGLTYEVIKSTVAGVEKPSATYTGFFGFAAYDFAIDRWLSFFPSAEGYLVQRGSTDEFLGFATYLPLLFHPAAHCFIGLGPEGVFDLYAPSSLPKRMVVAVRSTIGIYF